MAEEKGQSDSAWLAMTGNIGGQSREAMMDVHVRLREQEEQLAQAQARIRSLEETNQALQAREQHAIEHGQARIRELEGRLEIANGFWSRVVIIADESAKDDCDHENFETAEFLREVVAEARRAAGKGGT